MGRSFCGKVSPMNSIQVAEVSATPSNVVHMSKMIQIRNVPDEMHRTLKLRATAAGMSLSDILKQELGQMTARPSMEENNARIKARGPSKVRTKNVVQTLRESRGD
jgi:plasmid stability protein